MFIHVNTYRQLIVYFSEGVSGRTLTHFVCHELTFRLFEPHIVPVVYAGVLLLNQL